MGDTLVLVPSLIIIAEDDAAPFERERERADRLVAARRRAGGPAVPAVMASHDGLGWHGGLKSVKLCNPLALEPEGAEAAPDA
jgi:hypothetical protein